jgi:hypothetical protein
MKLVLPNTDAHSRLILALIISGIVFLTTIGRIHQPAEAILVWNVFAWSSILLAWARILLSEAKSSVLSARLQDSALALTINLASGLFGS